jgi:hypothetical protein
MAVTITGTQVQFPSNGNMEGFYTGSTQLNTSFPIGTVLGAYGTGTPLHRNESHAIYVRSTNPSGTALPMYYIGSGTAMAGLWASRGYYTVCLGAQAVSYLMQRIS